MASTSNLKTAVYFHSVGYSEPSNINGINSSVINSFAVSHKWSVNLMFDDVTHKKTYESSLKARINDEIFTGIR